jgi:hypothetical protein
MPRQKKIVIIRMGWGLGSAVACVVTLAALAFYFITLNPATSPAGAKQITGSDEPRAEPASAGDSVREGFSQPAAESRRERENAFSADRGFSRQDKPFYEFSGITTIDPDSPSTTPTPEHSPEPEAKVKAPLPVVFQPVDPKLLKLTPEQQKVIDQLKQSFLDMMGSAPQDPNDPKYLERWEEAQPHIDQQLKAQLGQGFFLRYEMATMTRAKR